MAVANSWNHTLSNSNNKVKLECLRVVGQVLMCSILTMQMVRTGQDPSILK